MDLFPFLCFSVLFCALVMVVNSQVRTNKIVPSILIAAEVYMLLLVDGIVGVPFSDESAWRTALCAIVTTAALVDFLRLSEKAFALLALYASLLQLLVSLDVLEGVSL